MSASDSALTLTVDGDDAVCRGSLLETCVAAGVEIPAFCSSPGLSTGGHCRACVVEVDGRLAAACTTTAEAGMVVRTRSERLQTYRRELGELMVSECRLEEIETPHRGPSPQNGSSVATWLSRWGVTGERYRRSECEEPSVDASHPYLRLDLERCIACRLCERACAEVQGQFVWGFGGRGQSTQLTWGAEAFADSDCVACGACVDVCPTAAISDVDRFDVDGGYVDGAKPQLTKQESVVRTTCSYCGVGCQLEVHVHDDDVQRIDGVADAAVNRGHLCVKGRYAHGFARHPDRLTEPLVRRGGELVGVSWEEALRTVAAGLEQARGRLGALSSSRCTNEENYLVQKWMRAGFATHNVDCCARVCHAPTAAGMKRVFGTGAATNSLVDIERASTILVAGSNATEAHPVTGARIRQAVLRGANLVVIDPRRTELARLADVHLALRPGTNVPLLNSLACALIEADLIDELFLDERTTGWSAYRSFVLETSRPEITESVTGVPADSVRRAAELYGGVVRPLQVHGLGMTEHYQGSESVMLLCNLALLVGAIGRDGVGVNPLRGQNNVQGAADMGCQPDALTGYGNPDDSEVRERFERVWERRLPTVPGLTLPRMYDAARSGELRALFVLGEDIVQSDPSTHVRAALESLDFLVVQELFLSETARLAHVVLPGASFLEKDGTFTNGERRVQRVRKALSPPGRARADWRILIDLMEATGLPQSFSGPSEIMAEIAAVSPAYAGIDYQRLDGLDARGGGTDGLQWPVLDGFHPGTPVLHVGSFPRGRAELQCIDYVPSPALQLHAGPARPLRLITGRVLEHYNCGSMTRRSPNLDLHSSDQLQISPTDAAARGISEGDVVAVESNFGTAHAAAHVTDAVAPGTVFLSFHFPDTGTNDVTTDVLDRLADCPEYKLTPVEVRAP